MRVSRYAPFHCYAIYLTRKLVVDEIKKRGGKRMGAGRKPEGKEPKKPLPVKVSIECRDHLTQLKFDSGHSKASIVEYAILKLKKLPKNID